MDVTYFLTSHGYKDCGNYCGVGGVDHRLFQKVVDTLPCHLNDKTFINVKVFEEYVGNHLIDTVTIEIVGDTDGENWGTLNFYGVARERLVAENTLVDFETRLIKAWEAMYRA